MPPLPRRDLRNLVRKLGVNARPSQQVQSLAAIALLCRDGGADSRTAIASAGAIPPMVQLLGVDSPADVLKLNCERNPVRAR
ncbi:hypothetical protein FOA52_004656 [Chlamydomonas sp. UWO 241]|nr:hypothetical protein FOA52_004656 [Chlamydomonas sp. UWO 241]